MKWQTFLVHRVFVLSVEMWIKCFDIHYKMSVQASQRSHISLPSGPEWHQMPQIWEFLRQFSVNFGSAPDLSHLVELEANSDITGNDSLGEHRKTMENIAQQFAVFSHLRISQKTTRMPDLDLIRCGSDWPQMCHISNLFGSDFSNVLKSDLKKYRICHI